MKQKLAQLIPRLKLHLWLGYNTLIKKKRCLIQSKSCQLKLIIVFVKADKSNKTFIQDHWTCTNSLRTHRVDFFICSTCQLGLWRKQAVMVEWSFVLLTIFAKDLGVVINMTSTLGNSTKRTCWLGREASPQNWRTIKILYGLWLTTVRPTYFMSYLLVVIILG